MPETNHGATPRLIAFEPWRLARLQRFVKHKLPRELAERIIGLYERNGELAVDWSSPPTAADQTAIAEAWQGGNRSLLAVEHYLRAEPFAVSRAGRRNPFA
jgi:hypothetical protein